MLRFCGKAVVHRERRPVPLRVAASVGEHRPDARHDGEGGQDQALEQTVSLTFVAVTVQATGTPSPSTATWYLVPRLARSVGFGPVRSPPRLARTEQRVHDQVGMTAQHGDQQGMHPGQQPRSRPAAPGGAVGSSRGPEPPVAVRPRHGVPSRRKRRKVATTRMRLGGGRPRRRALSTGWSTCSTPMSMVPSASAMPINSSAAVSVGVSSPLAAAVVQRARGGEAEGAGEHCLPRQVGHGRDVVGGRRFGAAVRAGPSRAGAAHRGAAGRRGRCRVGGFRGRRGTRGSSARSTPGPRAAPRRGCPRRPPSARSAAERRQAARAKPTPELPMAPVVTPCQLDGASSTSQVAWPS